MQSEPAAGRHWVFGYGSLIWRQDFPFHAARRAELGGWERRFWQGSHDHRGVPDDPGRVVTLVDMPGAVCVGRAFLVDHDVFEHLDHREKNGYERLDVTIRFADGAAPATTYVGPAVNFAYLGPAPLTEMVEQIRRCNGPSGSNIEYVLELARALRSLDADDPHVFELAERLGG